MEARAPVAEPAADRPPSADDAVDVLIADVFNRDCPSRQTMDHLTSRWGALALLALTEGRYRFNALRRRVDGVSEKMLAQSLQALERDGLIDREVVTTIPPRVEYSLTPLGERAAEQIRNLVAMLEGSLDEVMSARAAYDARGPV